MTLSWEEKEVKKNKKNVLWPQVFVNMILLKKILVILHEAV